MAVRSCMMRRPSGRSRSRSASMVGGIITPPLPIACTKRETPIGVTSTGPCPMAIWPHSWALNRSAIRTRTGGGVIRRAHAGLPVFQKPGSPGAGGSPEYGTKPKRVYASRKTSAPSRSRAVSAICTAAVLHEYRSISRGTWMEPCEPLSKLRMRARPTWMKEGQGICTSPSPFSHQMAASASLNTEPGGA